MARGTQAQWFHRADTMKQAIERMSDLYLPSARSTSVRGRQGVSDFLRKFDDDVVSHGFGSWGVDEEGNERFRIGLVGDMWAMLSMLPLAKELKRFAKGNPEDCARAILGTGAHTDDVKCLGLLIKSTTTGSEHMAKFDLTTDKLDELYKAVRAFAGRILAEIRPDEIPSHLAMLLEGVLRQEFQSPEDCAEEIERVLDLAPLSYAIEAVAQNKDPNRSYLEPTLDEFLDAHPFTPDRDDDKAIKSCIAAIDRKFAYDEAPAEPFIALLEGPEQSGKKSIVGDFLRRLRARKEEAKEASITYQVSLGGSDTLRLPIFVVSLRDHDYCSLAAHVLAFLLRLHKKAYRERSLEEHAQELKIAHARGGSPEKLINMIRREHRKQPVLFGFLDAHGLDRDSLQRVIRHSGLYRLLVSLWETNPQSRYLITTAELDRQNAPSVLRLNRDPIRVQPPTFQRFSWCLRDLARDRYKSKEGGISLEERLLAVSSSNKKPKVNGDALLVLSVLFSLTPDNEQFFGIAEKYISDRAKGGTAASTADEGVYLALVEALSKQGTLLPIAIIAATRITEDILSNATLEVLFAKYFEQRTGHLVSDSMVRLRPLLDSLARTARKLFLAETRSVCSDPDEFGFTERKVGKPSNWFMSEAIARGILDAMLKNGFADLGRDALRLVATAARRRAQWKRVRRSDDASMEDRHDTARDIQCYVAMLASLPETIDKPVATPENAQDRPAHSLYRSVDKVFTTNGERFRPHIAYRFAVLCLLRQQIDFNYRLSMVTDQDELRLKLYLLAFVKTGRLQKLPIRSLRKSTNVNKTLDIDAEQCRRVRALLGDKDYLELLLTVALSAYHCQMPTVVTWAWEQANDVIVDDGSIDPSAEKALRARLACTVADVGILMGRDVLKGGKLGEVKTWIEGVRDGLAAALGGDPMKEKGETLEAYGNFDLVKARMRVAAREAELNWITGSKVEDQAEAERLYERLEDLEDVLAEKTGQQAPIILSGRTARRYARFQGDDYPLIAKPWFATELKSPAGQPEKRNVLFIIQTNILRLNEYAGADRIGVLLDQARRYCLRGDYATAFRFAYEADKRLDYSRISHGGKLEVFVVKAGVALISAESTAAQKKWRSPDVNIAIETADRLTEIADDLKLLPAKASGRLLAGRARLLQNCMDGLPLLDDVAKDHFEKAAGFAHDAGHVLINANAKEWLAAAQSSSLN